MSGKELAQRIIKSVAEIRKDAGAPSFIFASGKDLNTMFECKRFKDNNSYSVSFGDLIKVQDYTENKRFVL